ncbi:hypothetical protein [Paracidobacterium acidisoli]|uniref:Antitoxin n=1 Tax=Paracidobacterium acidisoli TaxID=2303751 RepID=A0A372IMR6_9BACT|nr:hypothetical protein [Paracidobacterium acidisoli]MBT9331837.1 hypothetical protein [Paracidobacterium acidisoli]
MKSTRISVTEAARNFADCVNRARYQNVSFTLLKSGAPVARLIPDQEQCCTGRDLAESLASARLDPGESAAWIDDLKTARRALKAPKTRWP